MNWNVDEKEQNRRKEAGIDYNIEACLEYNSLPFSVEDIEKIVAVWEGEHDGDDWRWIIKLTKNATNIYGAKFVFMQGGCDYTGWDCQSWATSEFAKSALGAAEFSKGRDVHLTNSSPAEAGLGHMINIMSGDYMSNANKVYDELVKQIKSSKKKTWRENKDDELGTSGLPKI